MVVDISWKDFSGKLCKHDLRTMFTKPSLVLTQKIWRQKSLGSVALHEPQRRHQWVFSRMALSCTPGNSGKPLPPATSPYPGMNTVELL